MENRDSLSVTQLNGYVKSLMESDDFLRSVAVSGEISNFKRHSSGHLYFTLKDERSEISAVMFRAQAARLTFPPANGMRVTLFGSVSVYEASGKYQIYVSAMTSDGTGALYEQFKRLFERLKSEGLFDAERKKPIPRFPRRIGIVTSPTGAAIRDMINVTGRRFPSAEILLCPALVQGAEAPADICRALALLDAAGECDVIIVGRGGGSAEDLWAFNDEELVRAVAAAHTPVISAVGHETDTTLCDYAADMRAPTPSAAAEQAVPDRYALLQSLDGVHLKLDELLEGRLSALKNAVGAHERHLSALSPEARLKNTRERLVGSLKLLDTKMHGITENKRICLAGSAGRLESVSPLAVIGRGYAIATDEEGRTVPSVDCVNVGEGLSVRVSDGYIKTRVEEKIKAE